MRYPRAEMTPDDPERLPPARRRRARRLLTPMDADERADFIERLAHRASPTLGFFLLSLLAGLVIGTGFLLDSAPILVLGALVAPFMAPLVGLSLGTVIGSVRLFFRSLLGLMIGSMFAFAMGTMAGYLAPQLFPSQLNQALSQVQLAWDDFLILALGAIWTSVSLARGRPNAFVSSIALAYTLYLPLTAAGFGLTSGVRHLWPDGLVVFAVHLAWAALLGALALAILGFRPYTLFGYTLGGVVVLVGVIMVIGMTGAGAVMTTQVALPTPTPTLSPTVAPSPTVTTTPVPPTLTPTATQTITPSPTPTWTITPSPTPVLAFVDAPDEFGGALLRSEPGFQGTVLTTMGNGTLVQVVSDVPVEQDNALWVEVIDLQRGIQGWMVQALLIVATPAPNWTPTS